MSCCVLFCVNNGNSGAPPVDVTFYKIPKEFHLKQLWTEAIGMPEWQLGSISEVCSAHFRELDFTVSETGEKVLVEGAVPNLGLSTFKDLQAADFTTCRVCLSMDRKMYHIRDYNLHKAYEMIVGVMVESADRLPQMLCWECTSKLISFKTFKEKAQTSHLLLSDKLAVKNFLTIGDIKSINRINYNLKSHLTIKYCKPIEIDVHIDHDRVDVLQEIKVEYNKIKAEPDNFIECNTELKQEDSDVKDEMNYGSDSGRDIDSGRDKESGRNIDSDIDRDRDIDSDSDIILPLSSSLSLDSDDLKLSESENTQARKLTVTKESVTNMKLRESENTQARKRTVTKKLIVTNIKLLRPMKKKKSEDVGKYQRVSIPELPTFEMRRLTLEEQLAEMQARAQSASYLAAPYKCDVCYRGFRSAGTLALHAVRHTDKCGEFECWVCKCRFRLERDVRAHVAKSHDKQYSCKTCSFVTQTRTAAMYHQKWHAGNTYTCPHCPTTLTKLTSYLSHLRVNHSSRFSCELCGYTYVSKRGVLAHKAKRHVLDKQMKLDGPYCEECQLQFANDEAYQRHLTQSSVHSSDTHPDRIRNDWPQYRKYLSAPQKQKEVPCEQCGERQVGYRAYAKHFRAAHPGLIRTKFKGKCMCEQCGKMFTCKPLLLEHMAWHSGEKKFKCDTCDKAFANKTALALHLRVHDEQAPRYSCPYCERKFKSLTNCNRHVKTVHKGEKEFQCEICDKQFTTADSKRSHVDHVHHKKPWPKRVRTGTPRAANRDK